MGIARRAAGMGGRSARRAAGHRAADRRWPARPARAGQACVAFNLLKRFRLYADAVLLFIADHAVPFTNNIGERAVRMPKVTHKISACFRTALGAENFCVIRSYLDTLCKQGHGMLDVLRRAFNGDPIRLAAYG